jgi:phosphoglycerate dehydrogenase-like enzyme
MRVLIYIVSSVAAWNVRDEYVERLREWFPAVDFVHARTREEALAGITDATAAFASNVSPEMLHAARGLKWIHAPAAGIGHMLSPALVASPVILTNSRGFNADSMAEHALALMLAVIRQIPAAVRFQQQRRWGQNDLFADGRMALLQGRQVGIFGLGRIGSRIADLTAAFGARVSACRRRVAQGAPASVTEVRPASELHAWLPALDVLVLAAPQTAKTEGVIGASELRVMNPEAMLINVSRGPLVKESALIEALQRGTIAAAALDVFEEEPLDPASPLWAMPNVLITPHVGGLRPDYWDLATDFFAQNLRRFLCGERLFNVVDKEAGY